jgi:hypothetical protein
MNCLENLIAEMGEKRNACMILMEKPERKRLLARPRRRWVDSIKIHFTEIEGDGMDWIDMAQDRDQWRALVNTVMNIRIMKLMHLFHTLYNIDRADTAGERSQPMFLPLWRLTTFNIHTKEHTKL